MTKVAVTTRMVTVNAAFLQELKQVNHELWQTLTACSSFCHQPLASQRACSEFVDRLSQLCDLLAMHFALEEAYGYFDNPVAVAPQLAERCNSLRSEHGRLYVDLAALVERSAELYYERKLSEMVACVPLAFNRFHQRLLNHECSEMELIQEAFAADLGTGD